MASPKTRGSTLVSWTPSSVATHMLDVVVVVSSSRPSSPRNTSAVWPRRAKTSAINGAMRRSGMAHARVEDRREAEADAYLGDRRRHAGCAEVDDDAQLLQDVGRAAL